MQHTYVLYLVPDLFGPPSGIARYCRMVCRALTEAGHNVTVVSLLDQPTAKREAQSTFPGLKYFACGGQRALFIRHSLQALRTRPDLVLVGHPHFAHLGWLLARLSRARLVNFIYGIDAWEPLSPSRRRALHASERIISISRFTAKRAAEVNGVPSDKVRILHNCLDPQFQPQSTLAANGSPSLLTVARISLNEQYKGHDVVIRALPQLLQKFPNLIYNVVGDGDGRAVLEELVTQQGVTHAVRFHGVVSEEELVRHYNQASIFVMPSRFEGFGFVFLEAMIYGVPVIGGNVDASPEVISDGETGFVVDPTSVQAIVEAASRLLSDTTLREKMGQAAIHHVEQNFGFPRFKQNLLSYLTELTTK